VTPTKRIYQDVILGLSRGQSASAIATDLGIDRHIVSGWIASSVWLDAAVRAVPPNALPPEALADLLTPSRLTGEYTPTFRARQAVAELIRRVHPDHFQREVERERAAAAAEAAERAREVERERAAAERADACIAADSYNLKTLVELTRRDWADGTADERARGLDTADARRAYRCGRGINWTCAGFGPYYEPTWSALRCRAEYAIEDAVTNGRRLGEAFADVYAQRQYWAVERELDAAQELDAYLADPFARRDALLPVTEADARALYDRVHAGGTLPTASRNRTRKRAR